MAPFIPLQGTFSFNERTAQARTKSLGWELAGVLNAGRYPLPTAEYKRRRYLHVIGQAAQALLLVYVHVSRHITQVLIP